jgi:predicted GIY-YIG superfamily endonuclease
VRVAAYVYLLRCADDSLYCGWTTDVDKRIKAHDEGRGARYTASRRPVALARAWEMDTHTQARRTEAWVKKLTRKQKDALVEGTVRLPPPTA